MMQPKRRLLVQGLTASACALALAPPSVRHAFVGALAPDAQAQGFVGFRPEVIPVRPSLPPDRPSEKVHIAQQKYFDTAKIIQGTLEIVQ